MGGILHFFDLNQASTSRKLLTHKRRTDGLEAPRNSLDFPMETSQSYHVIHENVPFSCQVKQQPSKINFYPSGTTMKKLIDEEMSNGTNTRRNAPSVVARLMGMDTLPSEVKPVTRSKESKSENSRNYIPRKEHTENIFPHYKLGTTPFKQTEQDLLSYGLNRDSNRSSKSPRLTKPQPREHPQEELLQKFKKEFEAWQTAKLWERSRTGGLDNNLRQGKDNQTITQEKLNKEKMALYTDTKRHSSHKKPAESMDYPSKAILEINAQGCDLHHEGYMSKQGQSSQVGTRGSRNRTRSSGFEQFPIMKFDGKHDRSSSPTRIVILKPNTEEGDDMEESWPGSSEIVRREGSMEDFLEEVKERLRFEIQGNARNDTMIRGSVSEIPFSERLTDPKQIARHIAKKIRESVTRDLGTTLLRSESTRSYRSEVQLNGSDSPEIINRDTRKLLSERLRNVLQNEADVNINNVTNGRSRRPSVLVKERVRLRPTSDFPNLGKRMSYWEDMKDVTEVKTGSFGQEQGNSVEFIAGDLSPRNFVRSLSAPVSGTAFRKLLLEDQHVLIGAHIRRKHEASENTSVEVGKYRKDGLSFKGRVSNLRHNLTLRGKLFGKKIQSTYESGDKEPDSMKPVVTAPSVVLNLGIVQENSTEVPPSPASVSSSSHDELCKPSHPSPVSPLEVPFIEDHPSLQFSGDNSSNLPESQILPDPVGIAVSEEMQSEEKLSGAESVDIEGGHEEAYLRDILIAAGLYEEEPFAETITRWDALTKPIAEWVFEEVEEARGRYHRKLDDEESLSGETVVSHKMLFDLLNEALPNVLTLPISGSSLKRFASTAAMPRGKKLLDDVWRRIEMCIHSPMDESLSLECMVARDVRMSSWSGMQPEDIDMIGGDVEWIIVDQLIDEFVWDLCS